LSFLVSVSHSWVPLSFRVRTRLNLARGQGKRQDNPRKQLPVVLFANKDRIMQVKPKLRLADEQDAVIKKTQARLEKILKDIESKISTAVDNESECVDIMYQFAQAGQAETAESFYMTMVDQEIMSVFSNTAKMALRSLLRAWSNHISHLPDDALSSIMQATEKSNDAFNRMIKLESETQVEMLLSDFETIMQSYLMVQMWDSRYPDKSFYQKWMDKVRDCFDSDTVDLIGKAGSILMYMEQQCLENPFVAPDAKEYNFLIDACLNEGSLVGLHRADITLRKMMEASTAVAGHHVLPNRRAFASIIRAWMKVDTSKAEHWLDCMEELFIPPTGLFEETILRSCDEARHQIKNGSDCS